MGAAGCTTVHEEHAFGVGRSRPVLARLLRDIAAGETLVVVRLDHLTRSVSHLLAVIERLGICRLIQTGMPARLATSGSVPYSYVLLRTRWPTSR
jgi:hypothetical protein